MTNNLDEFDQDLDNTLEDNEEPTKGGALAGVVEAWRTQPLFKLGAIMAGVVIAVIVALNVSSAPTADVGGRFIKTPGIKEAPGGKASPYFIEQNKQAANQRAEDALTGGGSAIPTPVGQNMDMGEISDDRKKDPLQEFRAETERLKQELKQEQKQNTQQIQQMQQQVQRQPKDDSLAQAMQKQMQQLMSSWNPTKMNLVSVAEGDDLKSKSSNISGSPNSSTATSAANTQGVNNTSAAKAAGASKIIVSAGTINYGQLLIEANSDVQGPILAQIVSGPLAGGRAIGEFKVENDYLVLKFNLVTLKNKEYSANILALNPNTTLGGMATEVDQRYMQRVVLPAAAAFVTAFGDTLGEGDESTTVAGTTVITTKAGQGLKEGMYSGIGKAGETVGQFLQKEADKTKPLVRIAAGTPMGMLFLTSVREKSPLDNMRLNVNRYGNMNQPVMGRGQNNMTGYGVTNYRNNYNTETYENDTGGYDNGFYYNNIQMPASR